jgi:hypothetical protein
MCGDAMAASVVVVTVKFVGFFLSTKFFVIFFFVPQFSCYANKLV